MSVTPARPVPGDRVRVVVEGTVTDFRGGIDEPVVLTIRTDQPYGVGYFHTRVPYMFADVEPVASEVCADQHVLPDGEVLMCDGTPSHDGPHTCVAVEERRMAWVARDGKEA